MSISRGIKKGHAGRKGWRIGDRRERCRRGGDTIHGSLARQASQPATVALGGFPLSAITLFPRVSRTLCPPLSFPHTAAPRTSSTPLISLPSPAFTHTSDVEKGRFVVCETRTKARRRERPSLRVRASFFFFFFLLLGNAWGWARGSRGVDGKNEEGKRGQRQRLTSRAEGAERGRGSSTPAREFSLGLVKMRHVPRARFVKMSHTVAINIDESCGSLRRDLRLRSFRRSRLGGWTEERFARNRYGNINAIT